jgi:hypothetical protein
VTGPELSASTAFDGVTSLVAKSLIQTEGAGRLRYRLLDMVEPNYQAIKVGAGLGSTIRAEIRWHGLQSAEPRAISSWWGDHEIEILSIE